MQDEQRFWIFILFIFDKVLNFVNTVCCGEFTFALGIFLTFSHRGRGYIRNETEAQAFCVFQGIFENQELLSKKKNVI